MIRLRNTRHSLHPDIALLIYHSCRPRYGHPIVQAIILQLRFLSFFSFSSPIQSGRRLDVYHTFTHDVALVRI